VSNIRKNIITNIMKNGLSCTMVRDPQQPVVCTDNMFKDRHFKAVTVGARLLPSSMVTH